MGQVLRQASRVARNEVKRVSRGATNRWNRAAPLDTPPLRSGYSGCYLRIFAPKLKYSSRPAGVRVTAQTTAGGSGGVYTLTVPIVRQFYLPLIHHPDQ